MQEMSTGSGLLAELSWRGLVQEQSEGLAARLGRGPISGYIGFDASATSLHVGHLLQVFLLTHLQRAGGRPVVVIGGALGMIVDPSGKSSERKLLDDEAIARNAALIRERPEQVLTLVTNEKSVFDRTDVAKVLHRYIDDTDAFQAAFAQAMAKSAVTPAELGAGYVAFFFYSGLVGVLAMILAAIGAVRSRPPPQAPSTSL